MAPSAQYVDTTLFVGDVIHHTDDVVVLCDVHRQWLGAKLRQILHLLDAARRHVHGVALLKQHLRGHFAHARRCASDEYGLHVFAFLAGAFVAELST